MASLMDARLRRLTARLNPIASPDGMLAAMAEQAAREFDLEPEVVLLEAKRILADMHDMTIDEYLALQGIDPAEIQGEARELLAGIDVSQRSDDSRRSPNR